MNISVEITCSILSAKEKERFIQETEHEISTQCPESLKKTTANLKVSLFEVPGSGTISGSALNDRGEEVIKITRQVSTGHTNYEYL
jgi:hypothetical protein